MMEDQVDGMVADDAAAAEGVAAVEAAEAVEAVEAEAAAVEEEALQVGTNSTPHSQRFEKFLKQMNLEEPMPNGWIKKICTADQVAVMPVNIDLLEKVPNTEGENHGRLSWSKNGVCGYRPPLWSKMAAERAP